MERATNYGNPDLRCVSKPQKNSHFESKVDCVWSRFPTKIGHLQFRGGEREVKRDGGTSKVHGLWVLGPCVDIHFFWRLWMIRH